MLAILFAFWLILNGRAAGDVLITGAVISLAVFGFMLAFTGWSIKKEITFLRLLPAAVIYTFYLTIEIFKANFEVIRLSFTGKISPCLRTVKTPLKTRIARSIYANSITLTPGTVTVQLEDDTIVVHCLTHSLAEGLEGSALEKRLIKMEETIYGRGV